MKTRSIFYLLAISVLSIMASCNMGQGTAYETVEWVNDGNGYLQFSTNDMANLDSIFIYEIPAAYQNPYTGATFELIRKSGYLGSGQGGYFCYQNDDNYYRILLSGFGKYSIVRKINGSFSYIKEWTISDSINSGYDIVNKVQVQILGTGDFNLYINDQLTDSFNDISIDSGSFVFMASAASNSYEAFPYYPMDMRFKLTDPVAVP